MIIIIILLILLIMIIICSVPRELVVAYYLDGDLTKESPIITYLSFKRNKRKDN